MQSFIGWDCANRTLAYTYMSVATTETINEVLGALVDELYAKLAALGVKSYGCDSFENISVAECMDILDIILARTKDLVSIQKCEVHDILNGKLTSETTEIERVKLLSLYLKKEHPNALIAPETITVIEHQPSLNIKTTQISNLLVMHFAENNPEFISPHLKNNINFTRQTYEDVLRDCMSKFLEKNNKARANKQQPLITEHDLTDEQRKRVEYRARKAHAVINYTAICQTFGFAGHKRPVGKKEDDKADAMMSVMAWIVKNRNAPVGKKATGKKAASKKAASKTGKKAGKKIINP